MVDTCFECGICCKLFLINLNEEEYNSLRYKTQFEEFGLVKDFLEAEMCGSNIIKQHEDGSCFYLEKGKCSIHSSRPKACQAFFCNSKKKTFKEMIRMIDEYKKSI